MLSFAPRSLAALFLTCALLVGLAAPAEAGDRIYVPSSVSGTSTVAVVDTATTALIATIPVGTTPRGIAMTIDGFRVYVANMHSNDVSVIQTSTDAVVATIPVGNGPFGIAVSADGSRVYVANQSSNDVSVIDASSLSVIATIPIPGSPSMGGATPQGIVVDSAGAWVYVANWIDKSVAVINATTNSYAGSISFASQIVHSQPVNLTLNAAGTRLYVGGWSPLFIIDTSSWAILNVLSMPRTESLSLSPDGSKLFMANRFDSTVTVMDTATNLITATVPVTSPFAGSLNASGTKYYLVDASTSVKVMDTAALTVSSTGASIPSGATAFGNSYVHSDACAGLTATPSPLIFPKVGGSLALQITAPATCKWNLSSTVPWLSFSPAGAIGSATVTVTAQANNRAPRGATINVIGVGLGASSTTVLVGQP